LNTIRTGAAIALLCVTGVVRAEELTQIKAEQLLTPAMTHDCGSYYTEQGDPAFADIDGKPMCNYVPRITSFSASGEGARADFNRDRYFDEAMSQTWLKDYAVMESRGTPGIIYKALKKNLDKWRAESAGVDRAARPGHATFKLDGDAWRLDSISLE
jgi:hypothetical protein